MTGSGANLALLLLGGYRALVNAATAELARRGHEDYRPVIDSALRAIAAGADNASELGRRLAVSKQAAAKTIALLDERGYLEKSVSREDSRRMSLRVTASGFEVLRAGEKVLDALRARWEREIGAAALKKMEQHLTQLLRASPEGFIDPGWLAQDQGARKK